MGEDFGFLTWLWAMLKILYNMLKRSLNPFLCLKFSRWHKEEFAFEHCTSYPFFSLVVRILAAELLVFVFAWSPRKQRKEKEIYDLKFVN